MLAFISFGAQLPTVRTTASHRVGQASRASDQEGARLRRLVQCLDDRELAGRPVQVTVPGPNSEAFIAELPNEAVPLLRAIVAEMARGNAVAVVPIQSALTTQQAAALLGVSRPHLISMLEAHRIPFHMVGKHRRVFLDDLVVFRTKLAEARKKTLDELAAHDQALGIL